MTSDELEEIRDWLLGYSCTTGPSALPIHLLTNELSIAVDGVDGVDRTWWESISAELRESQRVMGPALSKVVGPSLNRLFEVSSRDRQLQVLRRQAQQLQSELRSGPAVESAFEDFVASVLDPSTPVDLVQWRRDATVAICEGAGKSWRDNLQIAQGVLGDRLVDVCRAREMVDGVAWEWPADIDAIAGLEEEARLDLARRVLLSDPLVCNHVVWFALDRARLHRHPSVTVGSVQFFVGGRIRDGLAQANPAAVPDELKGGWLSASDIPNVPHLVMARVDLGRGVENDAVARARDLLTTVVSAASFRAGLHDRQVWRLFEGHLHVIDGAIAESSSFFLPGDDAPWHEIFESVSRVLSDMSSEGVSSNEVPLGMIKAIRWLAEAAHAEPAMSVLLAVQVIELAGQQAGTPKWHVHGGRYFVGTWLRQELVGNLIRVVRRSVGLRHSMFGNVDGPGQMALDGVLREVFRYGPGAQHEVDIPAAANSLGSLRSVHSQHSALGRELRSVESEISTPDMIQLSIERRRVEWDLLLRRLQRVRNGITHGSDGAAGGASQVSLFGLQLAGLALTQSLEAALAGSSPRLKCEELRSHADNWINSIGSARSGADALIGPA